MSSHHGIYRAALLVGLAMTSAIASADHSWGKYQWDTGGKPLALDLVDNVDSSWDGHLLTASIDWTQSEVVDTTIVDGSANPATCDPVAGNVQVCNAAYGNTGWLGIAQIWTRRGSKIIAGVAKLNDTYYNTATYNTPAWRLLVMCQEVAHTFGLGHQDEAFGNTNLGSCMDYTDDPDGTLKGQLSNEHPNQHDYDQLLAIYSDSKSDGGDVGSCNPKSPKCNLSGVTNERASWGRRISGRGGVEVYERILENGVRVLTHVTWTLEHAEESHDH